MAITAAIVGESTTRDVGPTHVCRSKVGVGRDVVPAPKHRVLYKSFGSVLLLLSITGLLHRSIIRPITVNVTVTVITVFLRVNKLK